MAQLVFVIPKSCVPIRGVPYASSQPSGSSSELYCDHFTLSSFHTTFVALNSFIARGEPEVIRVTFKSASDNSSPSVSNLGRVIAKWKVYAENSVAVHEDAHA
eukprot:228495_1